MIVDTPILRHHWLFCQSQLPKGPYKFSLSHNSVSIFFSLKKNQKFTQNQKYTLTQTITRQETEQKQITKPKQNKTRRK